MNPYIYIYSTHTHTHTHTHMYTHTHTCKHIYLEHKCHKRCGSLFANSGGLTPLSSGQPATSLLKNERVAYHPTILYTHWCACVCMHACVCIELSVTTCLITGHMRSNKGVNQSSKDIPNIMTKTQIGNANSHLPCTNYAPCLLQILYRHSGPHFISEKMLTIIMTTHAWTTLFPTTTTKIYL